MSRRGNGPAEGDTPGAGLPGDPDDGGEGVGDGLGVGAGIVEVGGDEELGAGTRTLAPAGRLEPRPLAPSSAPHDERTSVDAQIAKDHLWRIWSLASLLVGEYGLYGRGKFWVKRVPQLILSHTGSAHTTASGPCPDWQVQV